MGVKKTPNEKTYEIKKSLILKYMEAIDRQAVIEKENLGKTSLKTGFGLNFLKKHILEFCKVTQLHGLKYIALDGLNKKEKGFWIFSILVCLAISAFLVNMTWVWSNENFSIESIETMHSPTWEMPFPAVTICSLNKVSKSRALDVLNGLKDKGDMSDDEIMQGFQNIPVLLGRQKIDTDLVAKLMKFQNVLDKNNINITTLIYMVSPPCNELLRKCFWKHPLNCKDLFTPSLAIEGACCSFNYVGREKTTMLSKNSDKISTAGCGLTVGMKAIVKLDINDTHSSFFGTQGVRIYIHSAFDYPDENASTKIATNNMEIFMSLSPEITFSTDEIKKYSAEARNCITPEERRLSYFRTYSYINCINECRGWNFYTKCNCVPYYMPNGDGKKVCTFNDIRCLYENKDILTTAYLPSNDTSCKCLPDCDHLSYPIDVSVGALTGNTKYHYDKLVKRQNMSDSILIHVYYNDLLGTLFRRDVFISWQSELASIGGILGLFLGFSFVSLFELLYFFTLRLFFDHLQAKELKKTTDMAKLNFRKFKKHVIWSDETLVSPNYEISIIGSPTSEGSGLTKLSE